jgi:hypothetical protein
MKIENDQYKEKDMGALFKFAANGVAAQNAVDDICKNYHKENPMSVQANKIASKGKAGARLRILSLFSPRCIKEDWTCEEIETELKLSHQTCSARLSELRREGKIKIVGERKTRSGSPAAVYQANE